MNAILNMKVPKTGKEVPTTPVYWYSLLFFQRKIKIYDLSYTISKIGSCIPILSQIESKMISKIRIMVNLTYGMSDSNHLNHSNSDQNFYFGQS
jgi:hypothetical protein